MFIYLFIFFAENIETEPFSSDVFKSVANRGASLNDCWQTISTVHSQFEKDGLLSVDESQVKSESAASSLSKPSSSIDTGNPRKRGNTTTYTSDANARGPSTMIRKQKKFINLL